MRIFILAFILFLLSMAMPVEAQIRVFDGEEFAPTEFHRTIYKMMEACTRIEGDFDAIRWYVAKLILVGDPDADMRWIGMWNKVGPEITFDREYVFDGRIVAHEVLHDLYEGRVPMDAARRCVLDWERLTFILEERDENNS